MYVLLWCATDSSIYGSLDLGIARFRNCKQIGWGCITGGGVGGNGVRENGKEDGKEEWTGRYVVRLTHAHIPTHPGLLFVPTGRRHRRGVVCLTL